MNDSIFKQIQELIADHFDQPVDAIKPETTFQKDLGADSLDLVEMIMTLEDTFDIQISDEEAVKIVSIEDAVKFIEETK
ncbi:acyl carrier protein [Atopobacter phocae]|uniref:acyl carrier protein n=1 Tax=Atopobacter phocae TaxID=136492 RepID=UPI000471D890|nr:acyl carrier protein [Atopobacter phocae]